MADFSSMNNTQNGFATLLRTNSADGQRIANMVQAKGERGTLGQIKKKIRIKASNKKVQKATTAAIVIAGIVAAPFTGGLSAAASIGLAIAVWVGDKAIHTALDKMMKDVPPDKIKEKYKSAARHIADASKHRDILSQAPRETVIENAAGREMMRYDPHMGIHLFKYTHHVYKAELRVKEMQDIVDKLTEQLTAVKENADTLINDRWQYTLATLKLADAFFTDPFDPDERKAINEISGPSNMTTTADLDRMNLRPIGQQAQRNLPPIPPKPNVNVRRTHGAPPPIPPKPRRV